MKKITPQTFWNIGSIIIMLPLVKIWFDEFMKHPYGTSALTGWAFILTSLIWSIWYNPDKNNDVNES